MAEQPSSEKRFLPRTVVSLGWVSFFADICSEMAYPILPLFVTGALKAPVWALGMIEGVAEATVSIMKGWSGFRSDRIGKRLPFIRWGYFVSALGKPVVGLAFGWPMVLVGRVLDRFGKGIRTTARDAMIADCVDKSQYGKAFGFHRAMDTAGAFVGVAIALALINVVSMRSILVWAVVPGLLAVAMTLKLKEKEQVAELATAEPEKPKATIREVIRTAPKGYWAALAVMTVFSLANTSDTFLLLRAKELGVSNAGTILAYMAYNVVVTLISTWAGSLSDRIGRGKLMIVGFALYAAVYLGFAFTTGGGLLWALFGFYGLYYGLSQGVGKALVADHSPAHIRASAIGLFYMVSGIATLLGNALMGLLWTRVSSTLALEVAAGCAIVALIIAPFALRTSGPTLSEAK